MKGRDFLLAALALSLFAVCTAQDLAFPFTPCQQDPVAYHVNSVVTTGSEPNSYCFTINVNVPPGCTDKCCSANLRKFEINVNPACEISGLKLSATLNGQPAPTVPVIGTAPGGAVNASVLRVSSLGLDLQSADGAVLCINLGTNSLGEGCLTLDALCVPPGGGRRGSCNTVLYDEEFDCCPVDVVELAKPPPPTPPSPPAPPPPPCEVCIYGILTPPVPDLDPVTYDATTCFNFQSTVSSIINALAKRYNVPLLVPFSPNPAKCGPYEISVCGVFQTPAGGKTLEPKIQEQLATFVAAATPGGDICSPENEGYTVEVTCDRNNKPPQSSPPPAASPPPFPAPRFPAATRRPPPPRPPPKSWAKSPPPTAASVSSPPPPTSSWAKSPPPTAASLSSPPPPASSWVKSPPPPSEENEYKSPPPPTSSWVKSPPPPATGGGGGWGRRLAQSGGDPTAYTSGCVGCYSSSTCSLPPSPLLNCTCNITQGILPFAAAPRYTMQPSWGNTVTYCFTIKTISDLVPSTCTGTDLLAKVEIPTDPSKTGSVRTISLYPSTGGVTTLSPSWAGNALKATPINWSIAEANGGKICIEVRSPATMEEICGGQCYLHMFNAAKTCCPAYRTSKS